MLWLPYTYIVAKQTCTVSGVQELLWILISCLWKSEAQNLWFVHCKQPCIVSVVRYAWWLKNFDLINIPHNHYCGYEY